MSSQVSYTDDKIVFIDAKGKSEAFEMFEDMPESEAIRALSAELKASHSASKGAISLLVHILDNPRLDAYRGTTPANEAVPNELKAAIREIETEFLKPLFCQPHIDKGAKPHTVEKLWQEYMSGLKAGGSYAVAKSEATKYFSYCGKTPKVSDNGLLLSVAAIKKLVINAKEGLQPKEKPSIADKLITLSGELKDRTENTIVGSAASAIAALKSMIALYEDIMLADMEAAQETHALKTTGDVASAAKAITDKAYKETRFQRAPAPKVAA